MPFAQFDRGRLRLRPLSERVHDVDRSCLLFPDSPHKTVLVRTVAEGGKSHFVRGDHRRTIPALYDHILARAGQ